MSENEAPRDRTDIEIEVMLDLEFLATSPSPEVVAQYARDMLRQAGQRNAREMLAASRARRALAAPTIEIRHIDWP